ncbi:TIGR03086 family metal-binding protein [Streptomyces sp. NPDC041068]|uniref:TIGR03086 family metal-binding protein n=1 Tax=Streptomyces sp. NPDC041068 TaxID=3155130 RepID=UPI0033C433B3
MIDLKPACRQMIYVLDGMGDEQLTCPTPCARYTVRDLIDHVDEAARGFTSLARRDLGGGDGGGTDVAEAVKALGAAWADPSAWSGSTDAAGVELPNELWGRIALTEMVVHGWDLAQATGQFFDLPSRTLHACYAHVVDFVPQAPLPELWGTPVAVPADAPLLDRVVAATGRRP